MMKELLLLLLLILLFLFPLMASGSVVIQQVLYDPIGTESGGEAVELYNSGEQAVDIGGWTLATASSPKDVVIPENTLLGPGQVFLIADEGWDEAKDNPEWCSASLEQTMTLANKDSGVALIDSNGNVVDAVGWGNAENIKQGLFEGSPAVAVKPGKALFRTKDTNNNANDFEAREPLFLCPGDVLIEAVVSSSLSARIVEDDDDREGVQVSPSRTNITVEANRDCVVVFGQQQVQIVDGKATLSLRGLSSGNHSIIVSSGEERLELVFEYLPLRQFSVMSRNLVVGKDSLRIANTGNTNLRLKVTASDLKTAGNCTNCTISKKFLFINSSSLEDFVVLELGPWQEKSFDLKLKPPGGSKTGTYTTVLKLRLE